MQQIQIDTVPQNILNYFKHNNYELLEPAKCDYNYLFKKRNNTRFKKLLEYKRAKTFIELENLVRRLEKFGPSTTEETYTILYGKELGKTKWEEKIKLTSFNSTKEGYLHRHGNELGEQKWKEYCDRQAYTNTFEYKNKKHGWSKEEFKQFNKLRSCTLENFKNRHGDKIGEQKWKEYCDRQSYTNTKEYLGDNYETINKTKGLTLETFENKYGKDDGFIEYEKYIQKSRPFYSKISQKLFDYLMECDEFKNTICYYATLNNEYGVYSSIEKRFFKYDFVCVDHNLCIEFHGDHYHGNPKIYRPDDLLRGKGQSRTTAKEAWNKDQIKQNVIYNERKYDTIVVWESDYKQDPIKVLKNIKNEIRKNRSI